MTYAGPPIIPGPEPDPEPVTQYAPPPYYPPPPQPVYYQHPPLAPAANPVRVAGNTVVVIAVLIGVFCVLPALACGVMGALGSLGR